MSTRDYKIGQGVMYHGTCYLEIPRAVLTLGIEAEINFVLSMVRKMGMDIKAERDFMNIQISHCVNQNLSQFD